VASAAFCDLAQDCSTLLSASQLDSDGLPNPLDSFLLQSASFGSLRRRPFVQSPTLTLTSSEHRQPDDTRLSISYSKPSSLRSLRGQQTSKIDLPDVHRPAPTLFSTSAQAGVDPLSDFAQHNSAPFSFCDLPALEAGKFDTSSWSQGRSYSISLWLLVSQILSP
jgi:hypothetical protein